KEPISTGRENVTGAVGATDIPDADPCPASLRKDAHRHSGVYAIRSYEVDACGRLSISTLCNFMQDAAGKHADELGVSVAWLQKQQKTWVLSRLALQMHTYPGWQETVHVATWPSGSRRLFALRNFLFLDGQNRLLGSAATAWLVIDTLTRRPLRIEPLVKKLNPGIPEHRTGLELNLFEKIPKLSVYEHEMRFRIRYQDLDTNRHVNNVSFIVWALECIPAEELQQSMLVGLEINYVAEAFHGDFVISKSRPLDGQPGIFLHNIIKEDGGQELFRARTVWKKMPY
ncbi:MAG: thioesterase, partial [Desulfobacterales bacterium]|nr:thioesterase [Desulfobacterales bacterium]